MDKPRFNGRRVLAFESRRADEIASLIASFGGLPTVAPAVREVPVESDEATRAFAHAVVGGQFDAVVFLTGVGVRALAEVVDRAGLRPQFLEALRQTRVIARGPKPVAALRELRVPVWVNAPEPNTWREVVAAVEARSAEWALQGAHVAVQEYGVPNPDLLEALRQRGATVTTVQPYRWAMPADVTPLQEAARAVAGGQIDVLLITSSIQIVHFWRIVREMALEDQVRGGLSKAVIASIGPVASAEIRRHGLEPAFEPSHPKMGLLVREAAERTTAV